MSGRATAEPIAGSIVSRVVIYGLLAFFAVVFLVPLFVMLITSLKSMDEIRQGNMMALPVNPTI